MTGLGVAFGPVTGGLLLKHFWWGSAFVVMAPVTALTLLAGVHRTGHRGDHGRRLGRQGRSRFGDQRRHPGDSRSNGSTKVSRWLAEGLERQTV
jgi:MFS family permease